MENEEETTSGNHQLPVIDDGESPETTRTDDITITSIDNESDKNAQVMPETNIQQENTDSMEKGIADDVATVVECGGIENENVDEIVGGDDTCNDGVEVEKQGDETLITEADADDEEKETEARESELRTAEIVEKDDVKEQGGDGSEAMATEGKGVGKDEDETEAQNVEKTLDKTETAELVENDDVKEQRGDESETMVTEENRVGEEEDAVMANDEIMGEKGVGKEEDAVMVNDVTMIAEEKCVVKEENAMMTIDETMITEENRAVKEEEEQKDDELMANDEKQDMEKTLDDTETETDKLTDEAETKLDKLTDTEMEDENEANLIDSDEDKGQEEEEEEEEEEEAALIESETESPESSSKKGGGSQGKRKRGGKVSKPASKSPATPRKTIEEDVCFICFDGGDLVLCDRRNCPKAYHPACVNRDDAFFKSKGRWNCGWHLCSMCEKKAEYMCYTCTFSLCKACIKTHGLLCVREKEKKGLCEACMTTVMKIEKPDDQGDVNFDDKNSWEHLFKDYWLETKAKNNLSFDELAQAKNPWKGPGKQESLIAQSDVKDDNGSGPENLPETPKARKSKRNAKKQKSAAKVDDLNTEGLVPENAELVSKELLEFVMHMRSGDNSAITKSEVQDLLLEYIKRNKLRDPSCKGFVICDKRLIKLFGKQRVAHIEMLKLLESHFFMEGDSQIDDLQETVVDTEVSPADDKDRKRKGRKKVDRRGPQSNRDDYAAIDMHNISMIYLRRKLVEDLLDDMETFHEKVVGTFVRIRISGANQKQDIYRLVQVKGTSEATQYTLGKRTTCIMLEILNLDKTEIISIDSISNQEFMEDECKRLRQSIKFGFINRPTVGDVLDKAMELQAARVNDWFETEVLRLSHLRDRASDLGRKKELRECVDKLNLLKMPEERARRLEEIPLIHDDPTMDPEHESDDDTDLDDKKQEVHRRSDSFRLNKRGRDQFSPRGDYNSKESWSGNPSSSAKSYEFSRSLSNRNLSNKAEDATTSFFEMHTDNSQDQGREIFVQQPIILEKPSVPSPRGTPAAPESAPKVNETEKMWHYKDPSEKIQGPFTMVQLRKWSKNGYFPAGLKIWRKSDKEDDGILLSDALDGKFPLFDLRTSQDGHILNHDRSHGQSQLRNRDTIEKPNLKLSDDIAKLPSPTPTIATTVWTGGQAGSQAGPGSYPSENEAMQSPTPNSSLLVGSSVSSLVKFGNNEPGSVGVSTFQPHNSITPVSVAVAPQTIDQGILSSVQSSQLVQQVAPPGTNMPPQMVQTLSGQISQGWSNAPSMILPPNQSMNNAGLQQVYNQWTGVPNMVQNPVGNFMTVPQEHWGQYPFPVNQPSMQQQQPPQPTQPPQGNASWGAMIPTPHMGWIAPNSGTPINWGPMVPGPQVTGNVDPTWVMQAGSIGPVPGNVQAGWVPQPPVQGVPPNQAWVATPIQGPVVPGNGNPGWVVPPGTQVAPNAAWAAPAVNQGPASMNSGWVGPGNPGALFPSQGPGHNLGWVPPAGNQGAPPPLSPSPSPSPSGNKSNNQNWGSRNHGNWGGNGHRGGFSGERWNRGGPGFRGNRRNYNNNQESFHKDGGSYHGAGMGDSSRSSDH
uniref:zinc finger CCCH domain-containing protein 19-like n=1 Tax=Erigeron canadensis TaxID=72917 RepID=UPI001CB9BCC2|nr:zinc finger CCCH domain-containing protein 19-like [Erigeron canadensis]